MCFFLSNETRILFQETVDRSNASSKITNMIDSIGNFYIEMMENKKKYKNFKLLVNFIVKD